MSDNIMQTCAESKALPSIVTDNATSGLGFGCMGITAFYGSAMDDDDAMTLLKTVYDTGVRHFDTAEIYKTGNPFVHCTDDKYNETIVGQFLNTVPRDSYTLATKYMPQMHGNACDYDTVKGFLKASLERLGLEYADLYYSHRVPSLEAAQEFSKTCKKLQDEGLIKSYGFSEICPAWLKKVNDIHPVTSVQQEWSLLTRNLEKEIVPMCAELGITLVAYSPLARALISCGGSMEAPSDWRGTLPRFQGENLEKNNAIIKDVVGMLADKYECTSSQLALAWLFKKAKQMGVTVVPIPGTTKVKHALANAGATKLDIGDDDMKTLDEVSDTIIGLRGDEQYISWGFEAQE